MAAIVPTSAELVRLIVLVEELLAQAKAEEGDFNPLDYRDWYRRHDVAVAKMKGRLAARAGARFAERPPHDYSVQIAGIRSTSTGGYFGALQNWKTAARKRIAQEGGV